MLALRYHPGESDFILEKDVTKPIIENEDDVLVKVEFSGLCGTDLHIVSVRNQSHFLKISKLQRLVTTTRDLQGEFGNCSIVPVTLGHEFSGIVVESGKNVSIPPGTKG